MTLRNNNKFILIVIFSFFITIFLPVNSYSTGPCRNTFLNPITDIHWKGIFPITIGGIEMPFGDSDQYSPPTRITSPICVCGIRLGISLSFWKPSRLADTVKTPYCFPVMGVQIANPQPGFLTGGLKPNVESPSTFAQVHWYIFPVFAMLDMFLDSQCLQEDSFDLAYMTEIDPTWNDDTLSFLLNPEALLFGNLATQLACVADSVAANLRHPIDALFWCMGSWGSVYPLSGTIGSSNYVQANAALKARFIFRMGRKLLLRDDALNICGPVMTPIWRKNHFKMHMIRPVKSDIFPIGRSSHLWGKLTNPPGGAGGNAPDNFSWAIFKKRTCCEFLF